MNQSMPPAISDQNQSNQSSQQNPYPYAGFWVRFAAFIVDSIILNISISIIDLVIVAIFTIFGIFSFLNLENSTQGGSFGLGLIFLTIGIGLLNLFLTYFYFIWFNHRYQATLGKMLMKIQVKAVDGGKLSLGNNILRETLGKFASSVILKIGFLMAAFTQKKQGLHDFIGSSVVKHKDPNNKVKKWIPGLIIGINVFLTLMLILFYAVIISLTIMSEKAKDKNIGTETQYQNHERGFNYDYDYDYDFD
ncbi:MAG: hypothetical protein GF332_03075 [Candidatus Moranbacteria bacterium]|nr:hypothetical protein [Candidatus Moranbacteria bacterium]